MSRWEKGSKPLYQSPSPAGGGVGVRAPGRRLVQLAPAGISRTAGQSTNCLTAIPQASTRTIATLQTSQGLTRAVS